MPRATSEEAFEDLIEHHLLEHGYLRREPKDFDPEIALIRDDLTGFIETTQPKAWKRLETIHGPQLGRQLVATFDKEVRQRGLLSVLRQGFKMSGRTLRVVTFRPAHGRNPDVERDYAENRVAVMRQVHVDPKRPGLEVDLALFVNGIPVVTAELKNALTHQHAGHAKRQYEQDRDP
ncbi:MAG: type I restriction endonuclease, partial [Acidobacteriota bacterium]